MNLAEVVSTARNLLGRAGFLSQASIWQGWYRAWNLPDRTGFHCQESTLLGWYPPHRIIK